MRNAFQANPVPFDQFDLLHNTYPHTKPVPDELHRCAQTAITVQVYWHGQYIVQVITSSSQHGTDERYLGM